MSKLKIYLAQINTTVGDLEGNTAKILREVEKAADCDLVVFPEMTICSYPCEDLWQKKYFVESCQKKIAEICEATKDFKGAVLLGSPTIGINRNKKEVIYNSALFIEGGEIKKIINKKSLPNYGIFDDKRYFTESNMLSTLEFRGQTLAILICEDLWDLKNLYLLNEQIFDTVITLNSSPYSQGKQEARYRTVKNFAKKFVYVNQVGGQDSLVFDGSSFVMNKDGEVVLQMKNFEDDSAIIEIEKNGEIAPLTPPLYLKGRGSIRSAPSPLEVEGWGEGSIANSNYQACVLGLRDYFQKNNFKKAILGMSGGIDSALVAVMAVDALGKENVTLYALPSRFNSESSMVDAKECAKNLGVNLEIISIEPAFEAMSNMLRQAQHDKNPLTQENLQSRIRGNILMAISNDTGALLLSTGNKSELAMGYATLYGDMCGAFNPIKDLYKTEVYELAKWRNSVNEIIPQNILTKAPSAELRPNQKDSDSLPEYDILDKILYQLIEEEKSVANIIKSGFDENLVKKIAKSFYLSEYKRKQSVLGPKLSKMAFDKDRRYPITNKFTQ